MNNDQDPAFRELEDAIRTSEGTVAVFLGEPYNPGARVMARRLADLIHHSEGIHLIEITFTAYRDWAIRHGLYGTPGLLLFRKGELTRRIPGLVSVELLREIL